MSNKQLVTAISERNEEEALRLANEMIGKVDDPSDILASCQEAMRIVGERYEKGDYFLTELIMSGEMLRKIAEIVKPKLQAQEKARGGSSKRGKVVLATVRGDIHDIGKDIVGFMLDVNGFEVHDLGVDVPEDKIVQAVKEVKPSVLALSGFLTVAYDSMKSTIEALKKAGVRDNLKIMIGGGQINDMVLKYTSADAFGTDAVAAVRMATDWTPKK
jgi:5-methyltetrahydrofolate--homocysteine methyltransferase